MSGKNPLFGHEGTVETRCDHEGFIGNEQMVGAFIYSEEEEK